MSHIGCASHARRTAVRLPLASICPALSGVSTRVPSSCIFAPHRWQHRAFPAMSTTTCLLKTKTKRLSKATQQTPATSPPSLNTPHSPRLIPATTSRIKGAAPPPAAAAASSTTDSTPSSLSNANLAATAPAPAPPPPVAAHDAERPRRSYAPTSAAISEQLASLRRELLETRMQLAKAEETNAGLYEGVLARLAETDRAALLTASSLRYTGMALRAAHDNLEVELRRLLTIGLTAEEVDAAAIEAGARQYVRQNIGYHTEHVAVEPPAVPDMARGMERNERRDALSGFAKSPQ